MGRLTETEQLVRNSKARRFIYTKPSLDKLNWIWVVMVIIIGIKLLFGV